MEHLSRNGWYDDGTDGYLYDLGNLRKKVMGNTGIHPVVMDDHLWSTWCLTYGDLGSSYCKKRPYEKCMADRHDDLKTMIYKKARIFSSSTRFWHTAIWICNAYVFIYLFLGTIWTWGWLKSLVEVAKTAHMDRLLDRWILLQTSFEITWVCLEIGCPRIWWLNRLRLVDRMFPTPFL